MIDKIHEGLRKSDEAMKTAKKMRNVTQIRFSDLNFWLKVAVIIAWIEGVLYLLAFFWGFLIGITGV